ncbi:MAG: glutamyl-tRNA reductase [Desulfurella sp.]|jgi:glutamyl-tRNA reductase|uniref:glutamyl-tRNA reductase n=1 Tax=Desulfurella TaxID=33001 RepID=UPI000CAE6D55|nr:glutamyl-tRNA reductase [Desulfurella multipotens]PMP67877.1 MAG: glutamyl-tRNA reductase [Desulfurella multipotens]
MTHNLNLSIDNVYIVGLNWKTAPLNVREAFVFENTSIHERAKDIKEAFDIAEIMIISTCNRTEIIAVSYYDPCESLIKYLSDYAKYELNQAKKYIYKKQSIEALRHIFELSSGLDSQVVGETQILSQLKDAYRTTVVYNLSGAILNRIMRKAFTIAKIVRSQTNIQKGHLSIASLASHVALEHFGLDSKKVIIIGSGDMARLSAKYFSDKGAQIAYIANRRSETVDFAQNFNAKIVSLEDLKNKVFEVDIVVSCIYTPKPVIENIKVEKKLLIMDLSVPSSISLKVKENPNIILFNLDDLKNMYNDMVLSKQNSIELSKQIIDENLNAFIEENSALDYNKTIDTLRQYADRIRKIELKKFQKKYKIDEKLFDAIDKLTRSILNKTLHEPTSKIRQFIKEPEGDMYVELIRRLFNISIENKPVNCFFSENPDGKNN